jgi:hypothetical protein
LGFGALTKKNCEASVISLTVFMGRGAAVLVEALSYKLDGLGFFPDEVVGIFSRPNPSIRTLALVSILPLTETNTRNLPEGIRRLPRK